MQKSNPVLAEQNRSLPMGSRWVTARVYGQLHALAEQTLANWRHQDKAAGRVQPLPGYPVYRHFGSAVRYWLGLR